ncbi:unnamed protein product [Allacma fusca]|uniref:Uncharacterized protein n=1 Tax=Allacma fusca TaxID=39272 RepID=A0A8J2PP94_9HEXA|nr:unnamed protein product [Allacma fusca]
MWKKRTGLLNIMYLRPQRFFVIEYLTIVLLIVFGSSVESTGSGFSVSDNKIPPRLQPEGVSNVLAHGLYPEDSDAGKDWQNDYPDSLKNSTPSIAKCCREGEGFNSDGECMKLDPSYKHNLAYRR